MNEREDKENYEEEGEYHFTEDQVNYEPEEEAKEKPLTATDWRSNITNKVSQNRRYVVGGLAFIVLLFVVYKVLMPASNVPPTQFTQAPPASPNKNITTTAPTVKPTTPTVAQTTDQPTTQTAQVGSTNIPVSQPNPLAAPSPQQQEQTPTAIAAIQQPSVAQMPNAQGGTMTTISTSTATTADKLAMLEQENSRLMNLLQSDYSQKIAEQQAQNSALQSRIQDLNNRIAMLESNLVKMTQMLQTANRPAPAPCAPPCATPCAVPKALGPRIAYTVQAIIPGRAWLKSDVGDTITVAEGDILRCVGRVTKIDPYDGVVQIDTGNRILTLSYGVNAD